MSEWKDILNGKRRPTQEQINRAKNCSHEQTTEFIDGDFKRIGHYCIKCGLVTKWNDENHSSDISLEVSIKEYLIENPRGFIEEIFSQIYFTLNTHEKFDNEFKERVMKILEKIPELSFFHEKTKYVFQIKE